MISRALDANNDILLDSGRIAITSDGAEVAQHVRTRLRFFKGEWDLDITAGVPWYQEILIRPAVLSNVESIIKREILSTPGVDELTAFQSTLDRTTRRLSISFSANTTYGGITLTDVYLNI